MTTRSRETFRELVTLPDLGVPLAEAALLMACEEYPHLSLAPYLEELDRMAESVRSKLGSRFRHRDAIGAINEVLFSEYGFEGNSENYYDPRNSFLNDVIERRMGIPITLSTIYIEVADRSGLRIDGIGIPGHFMVKYASPADEIYIDPFNRGAILAREECLDLVGEKNIEGDRPKEFWLRRVTSRQILMRMLANLRAIYVNLQMFDKALGILDLMILVRPSAIELYRARGLLRLHLGQIDGATGDLRWYLKHAPAEADRSKLEGYLKDLNRIRAMRN